MVTIGTLNGGNITITTGGSAPASHEETWYKYSGDTEWRTTMLSGTIALVNSDGDSTNQIDNPYNIVAIEIGTGTTATPVTSIGEYAFYDCSDLMSVTIGNGVTSIGGRAFGYCSSLESVMIPDSVTSIGSQAFSNCSDLTNMTIPNSVEYI